jgi:hypothetical protein
LRTRVRNIVWAEGRMSEVERLDVEVFEAEEQLLGR